MHSVLKKMCWLFLSVALCFSCNEEDDATTTPDNNPNVSINKIMPLGASRVEGARPIFESYRYELWKDLIDGDFTFDYIGTMDDNASYPEYSGANFDMDHEGRGGFTSAQILNGIEDWLNQAGAPDIVLFSSPGGNDALQGLPYANAITNINAIIDIIQQANPNVTIIIEQPAPGRTSIMTPALTNFFNQLQQDVIVIADAKSTATSQIIPVDMFTGFSDALLEDSVHYNQAGAEFIAERYYNVLSTILE